MEDIPHLLLDRGDKKPLTSPFPCLTPSDFVTSDDPRASRSMPSAFLSSTGFRGRLRGHEKGGKTQRAEDVPRLVMDTIATWAGLTPAAPVALASMSPQLNFGGRSKSDEEDIP